MEWFTNQKISAKRSLTPEGYLLCEEVPIARIGPLLYAEGEVPITPTSDGLIRINRTGDELFNATTMASFNGKPIVMSTHPNELVSAASWKTYAVGTMFNTRRGDALQDDYLFADLLITDAEAVKEVENRNPELSCGYDAQYEELEPGRGRQYSIIGNHVAILADKGRCGPTCSIGDSAMTTNSVLDRVRQAFLTKDAKAFDQAMMDMVGPPGTAPGQPDTAAPMGAGGGSPHRIVVNVHGGAAGAGGAADAGGGGAPPAAAPGGQPGVVTTPPPAVSPSEGGAGSVDQRLASIEAMLNQLMAAMGGEEEEAPPDAGGGEPPPKEDSSGAPPGLSNEKTDDAEGDANFEKNKYAMPEMTPPGGGKGDLTSAVSPGKIEGMMGNAKTGGTMDSEKLTSLYQDTVSRAEILYPGLKPKATFDAKATAAATYDCVCDLRLRALEGAMGNDKIKPTIAPLIDGRDLRTVTNDELRVMFVGASELIRRAVNGKILPHNLTVDNKGSKGPPTLADMNKRNEEFWSKRTHAA